MTAAPGSLASVLSLRSNAPDETSAEFPHGWVMDVLTQEAHGIARMLWRLLGNEADVLDAIQDTFCHLAQRKESLKPESAQAYVYRTAANIGIELIRARIRQGRRREALVSEYSRKASERAATPQTIRESQTDRFGGIEVNDERLRKAIGNLPPHLQGVVVLRDLGRLNYQEVGRMLGISAATARVYRRHAVVRLAELLGGAD